MKQSDEPLNHSVKRAIRILEYLATVDGPRDLAVISRELGMNKSTVYRFLSTLEEEGYVHQDALSNQYSLGSKVTWLAANFLAKIDVRSLARPFLEELARVTGETVHVGILDQDEVIYIDKIDGNQAVHMASQVGAHVPVHTTAMGKVLLSGRPETYWQRYVDAVGLYPRTPFTIVEQEGFFAELRRVRANSYAIDNLENEEGIRCLAAAIFEAGGEARAAISISGWTLSMTPERTDDLAPVLLKTAASISQRLGFSPASPPVTPAPELFPRAS
jgi:IclR family KDG regulon transcriptional repressor